MLWCFRLGHSCRRAWLGHPQVGLAEQGLHRGHQFRVGCLHNGSTGNPYKIVPGPDVILPLAHNFAQTSFCAVTYRGFAYPTAHRKAKPTERQPIGEHAQHTKGVSPAPALPPYLLKTSVVTQPVLALHRSAGPPHAPGTSHRQPLATLQPPALQHTTPTRRAHPRPKSMGLRPLALLRLVCSLRHRLAPCPFYSAMYV